jgi:hypothetical protein
MSSLVIQLVLTCADSAEACLQKLREVLETIERAREPWPTMAEWEQVLPPWFVAACSPAMSVSEAQAWLEQWRAMSQSEQSAAVENQAWSLPHWLYWMDPKQSVWRWRHATVRSPRDLEVSLEVDGWPVALGAFNWLARTAGASQISAPGFADPP